MMDVRANSKDYVNLQKAYKKSDKINKEMVKITLDKTAEVPIIMIQNENKELVPWTIGFDNVMSFIKHGYVKISDGKYCPLIKGKCKGKKCALYLVENNTGDCSIRWTGIRAVFSRLR